MYRLLIITDSAAEKQRIEELTGWEALGFKPPRIRENAQEMRECMQKHAIDAIAVDPSMAFDNVREIIDREYPTLPIFLLSDNAETQMAYIRELGRMLGRLRADDSDDKTDSVTRFAQQRDRWMKRLIAGAIHGPENVERHLRLYRCPEHANQPALLLKMRIPDDDAFLSERWHYGGERLETALTNFYGTHPEHMFLHLVLSSPQELRIVLLSDDQRTLNQDRAIAYVRTASEQITHYLGLKLELEDCETVPELRNFAMPL